MGYPKHVWRHSELLRFNYVHILIILPYNIKYSVLSFIMNKGIIGRSVFMVRLINVHTILNQTLMFCENNSYDISFF